MKRTLFGLLLVALVPLLSSAQNSGHPRGQGYVYFAPGVTSPSSGGAIHLGGGGEGLIVKGLGVGADVGYLAPWKYFADGLGLFSPNVSITFFRATVMGRLNPS